MVDLTMFPLEFQLGPGQVEMRCLDVVDSIDWLWKSSSGSAAADRHRGNRPHSGGARRPPLVAGDDPRAGIQGTARAILLVAQPAYGAMLALVIAGMAVLGGMVIRARRRGSAADASPDAPALRFGPAGNHRGQGRRGGLEGANASAPGAAVTVHAIQRLGP